MRWKLGALYAGLLAFSGVAFLWLFLLRSTYAPLVSLGLLAYVFGLRHALDADHIAAIDNTTRKLMHDGQEPLTVGLFFSLGHSTIVLLLSLGLTVSAHYLATHLPFFEHIGTILGTAISALFLYLIALLNLFILRDVYGIFQMVRREGRETDPERLEELLQSRGLMNRVAAPLYRLIRRSWQMYPVGVLFGLGFDTASEVALLSMAALAGARDVPPMTVLVLPVLFAAGMMLIDTTDGVLMSRAYSWAFQRPLRKVYYNLTITTMSVFIALVIGTVEALQVASGELGWHGSIWRTLDTLHFGFLGYLIVGILLTTWLVAVVIYRLKGFDRLEGASLDS